MALPCNNTVEMSTVKCFSIMYFDKTTSMFCLCWCLSMVYHVCKHALIDVTCIEKDLLNKCLLDIGNFLISAQAGEF